MVQRVWDSIRVFVVKKMGEKLLRICLMMAVFAMVVVATPGEGFAATDVCLAVTDNNQTGTNVSSRQSVFIRDDLDENGTCTHAFVANTSIGNMGTDIGLNRVAVTLNTFDNNSPAGSATGVKIDIDSNYTIHSMAVTVGGVSTTVAQNVESFIYNTVTTATSFNAVIQIQRNTDNRVFDFTVSKAANSDTLNSISFVPSGGNPEINVKGFSGATSTDIDNGDISPNGGDGTLFTSAPLANFGSHTQNYTIENLGAGALTLGASAVTLSGSSDFSVEQQPATSVGASATTTFKIKFTPTSVTQQDATVSIANNDSNEAPYTFAIRAIGTFRPTLDKTFSPSTIIVGGTSTITYTITDPALIFSGVQTDILPAGLVVASAPNTTTTCSNGDFNSPSAGSSTISFNISLDGSCALTIDVTASTPGVFLDPIASTSSPIADISGATDTLTVVAAVPEINVVGGGNNINDGDTTPQTVDGTAFSEALVNTTTTSSTFTIQNTGTGTLTLGANAVSITGTHSGDYTVTAQPATTVAAGGNTQFMVQFAPTVMGARNAIININNDDGDETPYDFAITGEGLPLVTLTKSISLGTIIAGETATYTYTYNNPTGALHGGVTNSFTDNLPANLIVATPNNTTSTCFSAGLIALAGASTISTTGVIIGVGGCQLTVDVTSNVPATYIDPVETLGQIIDPASNLSATLTVIAAAPLQASVEFERLVNYREKNQELTLTLENTTSVAATNVVMTFNLPAGMRKHEASIDSNANCSGGTFTGGQGATSFSYGNGSIPGNSSCIISFKVVSSTTGTKMLSTGVITSNLGVTTAASAQTNIAPLPTHAISYSPVTIAVGQVSTLTFSITTYDEDSGNLNDVAVGMELPAGLKVAPTENVGGTCNSQGDTVASDRLSFTLYGSTSPQPTCTHSIDVIGEVVGSYTTPSKTIFFGSDITAGITTPSANATLTVTSGSSSTGEVTIIQNIVGGDTSVSFTSATSALNFALTTVNGQGQILAPNVAEGTHEITAADLSPQGYGLESIMCSDSDSTGDVSTRTATINLASNEAVTCTFSMIETREVTSVQIADYMGARNTLLLSHQPERNRRLEKLKSEIGDGENSEGEVGLISGSINSFAGVPINSLTLNGKTPLPFNATVSDDTFSFNTSLREIISSGKGSSYAASNNINKSKWDIWSEGHFARFDDDSSTSGRFGVIYGGIEHLVKPNMLIGIMGQYDWLEQKTDKNGAKTSGTGWMIGPYSTLKLDENLYFDIRGAWGRSRNKINPFGIYEDTFETERWLISSALIGEFKLNNLTIKPAVSLQYIEDAQSAYTDSLNVSVPRQTISQGDLRFGPRITFNGKLTKGTLFTPWAQIEGVYTFGQEGLYSRGSFASQADGLTAKLQAGFSVSSHNGTKLNVSGNVTNLGSSANAYGASFKLTIPLK